MDDVIRLIAGTKVTIDEYGNQTITEETRTVFCKVNSVGRTEFYQAAQNDMHPEYLFHLSHFKDYLGETELYYTDWTGTEKRYTITRTYRRGDAIELTAEERIGDYGVGTDSDGETP